MPESAEREPLMEGGAADEPAGALPAVHQTVAAEQLQRLPHRHPARPVPLAERGFAVQCAGTADVAHGDPLAEVVGDVPVAGTCHRFV